MPTISTLQYDTKKLSADLTVFFVPSDKKAFIEETSRIQRTWRRTAPFFGAGDFKGDAGSSGMVYTGAEKAPRVLVVGLGKGASITPESLRKAGALAAQKGAGVRGGRIAFVPPSVNDMTLEDVVHYLVEGGLLANYAWDELITIKERKTKGIKKISLLVTKESIASVRVAAQEAEAMASATLLARDLANAPSNVITPRGLADACVALGELGVDVTVLDKKEIEKIGMGGLLAVNRGSTNPPHFVIMEWKGGAEDEQPIVLVGKGITFDSGGISLKPGAGMGDMKMDMGGAAAVVGAMKGIASLKVARNVVALVPTTENMPSGSAYKPGDVITLLNGKTAEIENTDAEGRMILADALTYAERYNPSFVVDFATLTGAAMIALGHHSAALMGNDDELKGAIKAAGEAAYERVTELPLWSEYEDQIKSPVADVKNTGGRPAGSITAGLFLQHFIGSYRWAHVDIAGVGISAKAHGYWPKGGTGFGARLIVEVVRGNA